MKPKLRPAALLLAALLLPLPARAETSPCGSGFAPPALLGPSAEESPKRAWMARPVTRLWGIENASLLSENGAPVLRVRYPAGSIDPGNPDTPRGGLGFLLEIAETATAREVCLAYRVRFPSGFAFAKGGKLPGLYGGDAPRGGQGGRDAGFSARLMWRAGGAAELYLYAPGQSSAYGESIGRGNLGFPTGEWVEVVEHLRRGDPAELRVSLQGRELAAVRRPLPDSGVVGLAMSTFFGGNGPEWASPRDQFADFSGFTAWVARD